MNQPGLMQVLTWPEWFMLVGVLIALSVAVVVAVKFFKIAFEVKRRTRWKTRRI